MCRVARSIVIDTLIVAAAYIFIGRLSIMLALPPGYATAIFPPAGIAIAAVYINGHRALIGVFIGSLLLNLWLRYFYPHFPQSFEIVMLTFASGAATLQAAIGGLVMRRRLGSRCAFDRARDLSFFLLTAPFFCLINTTLSIGSLSAAKLLDQDEQLSLWLIWWLADTMGVLIAFPIVMVLFGQPRALWCSRRVMVIVPMLVATTLFLFAYEQARRWEEFESLNFLRAQIGWQSWAVLSLGLFGTGLLGAFLMLSSGHSARVKWEVNEGVEALRASTEKLRSLFELSPLGIALADMNGRYVEFNEAFCRMTGYSPEELKTLDSQLLTPEQHRDRSWDLFHETMKTGRYGPYEKEYRRKDGTLIPICMHGMLITGKNGERYICSLIEDISERKRTEQALRESDERWQFALEGAGDGVWDIDLQTQEMFLSARNMAMLGYEEKSCRLGTAQWKALIHPEDLDRGKKMLSELIKHGKEFYVFDFRALAQDGQWRWLRRRGKLIGKLPSGYPARMIGTHTDIDDAKQREQKDSMQAVVMAMIARSDKLFHIFEVITDKLNQNNSDIIYTLFAARQGKFSMVTSRGFSDDQRAALIPLDERMYSGGSAIQAGKKVQVTVPDTSFSMRLSALATEGGYTVCWTQIIATNTAEIKAVLVAFKRNPVSAALPNLDYLTHAASLAKAAIERILIDEQLKLIASVYEACGEAILVTDAEGHILAVNPAFTRITGYSSEEVCGRVSEAFQVDGDSDRPNIQAMEGLEKSGFWKGEIWGHRKDGSMFPIGVTVNTVWDENGKVARRVCVFSDITDKKISEERIQYLATHDALTALPNRTLLQDRLQYALAMAQREHTQLGLLYVDLDHFKPVNDTLGHDIGDQLLKAVAVRMLTCVRESDTVARVGGDEFVVLLPTIKSAEDAFSVGEKIIVSLSRTFEVNRNFIDISASVGVAIYPEHGVDEAELSQHADVAMYRAKLRGRNTIEAYKFDS